MAAKDTTITFELPQEVAMTLKDIPVGNLFQAPATLSGLGTYMRVAPVKMLVRSTMVHEVLTRGDCFVVDMSNGLLTVLSYNTVVFPLTTTIQCTRK